MKKNILKVVGLKKYFSQGKKIIKALDGVSFEIKEGETLGLVGESGCGKSTLGRTILKLYEPTEGEIRFKENNITDLSPKDMIPYRKDFQIIFQDPYSSLNPRMTAEQLVGEALLEHKIFKRKDEQYETEVRRIMELCGLASYHMNRYPHEFSGGQRQRLGIARALALNPSLIVCDEVVSALDVSIQAQIINLLMKLKEEFSLTYIFISHNLSIVKHISDRIGVMYLGNLVELSSKEDLFEEPLHPYTQSLLSSIPTISREKRREFVPLSGEIPSNIAPPPGCKFHTRCPKATERCKQEVPSWREVRKEHFVMCHEV
jgi:oligopeptide/dipeptide ABC transporter ATP-binding protein